MIRRDLLTAWSAKAPWPLPYQIEQDLIIAMTLIDLFSDPFIAQKVAFRGGTALHKLYLAPGARYSEDIDLVQLPAEPSGPLLRAIAAPLSWLGEAKSSQGGDMTTLEFWFETEAPVTRQKLKVEINTREHDSHHDLVSVPFHVDSLFRGGPHTADIRTYCIEELLATKLRALYQRRKGRDVFDLAYALDQIAGVDIDKLLVSFRSYVPGVTRGIFIKNFEKKRARGDFLAELVNYVDPKVGFDSGLAAEIIQRELIDRI